jgi:hypothetical protein
MSGFLPGLGYLSTGPNKKEEEKNIYLILKPI